MFRMHGPTGMHPLYYQGHYSLTLERLGEELGEVAPDLLAQAVCPYLEEKWDTLPIYQDAAVSALRYIKGEVPFYVWHAIFSLMLRTHFRPLRETCEDTISSLLDGD